MWTVLLSGPRGTLAAAKVLTEYGSEAYVPMFPRIARGPTRKPISKMEVAWPGYIISRHLTPKSLARARSRELLSGTLPVQLSNAAVDKIKFLEQTWRTSPPASQVIVPGDEVIISAGWLEGKEAVVLHISNGYAEIDIRKGPRIKIGALLLRRNTI